MSKEDKSSIYSSELPSYTNPPVNEVVCGLRFQIPNKFKIPHLGLLWDKFRNDYPNIQHAPQIAEMGNLAIDVAAGGIPLPRVWFLNKNDDQLIQFQFDRIYFNWRSKQSSYPRYGHIIEQFKKVYNSTKDFFSELELGNLIPIELELSYINHIVQGEGWENSEDVLQIFSDFTWRQEEDRFLPNPLNISWFSEFPITGNNGRLIVSLKQATRREDDKKLLVLELKAKSESSVNENDMYQWYDIAHQWIVRGFTDITTKNIQRYWEREK